jgi:hypothetical protein
MPLITVNKTSLHIEGPLINIIICPPLKVVQQLKADGKQSPAFKAIALTDTGATATCISTEIVTSLGLVSFDTQRVYTAAGESEQYLYDIGVGLPISQPNILAVQAPCADLFGQPFQVLLGRDILSMCTLFYNGVDNTFVLHY